MSIPKLNGDKLACALLTINPDLPIIICTGDSKQLSEDYSARIVVKAMVFKPLVKSELAIAVRSALDG